MLPENRPPIVDAPDLTDSSTRRSGLWQRAWVVTLGLFTLTSLFIALGFAIYFAPFSTDSWGLFELSKSIFSDFYRINTWRQFQTNTPYSSAFPPLYPTVLALAGKVGSHTIYTGYIVNFILFAGFCWIAEKWSRALGNLAGIGVLAALTLWLFPPFRVEILAARTIPLFMLLAALVGWMLAAGPLTLRRAAMIGVLAGLMVMTRFDGLPFAVAMAPALWLLARNIKVAVVYSTALMVVLTPWIFYSLTTFGKLFTSDNAQVTLSVARVYVLDLLPAGTQTLFDDPAGWALRIISNVPTLGTSLVDAGLSYPPLWISLGFCFLLALILKQWPRADKATGHHFLVLGVCAIAMLPAYLTTGYFDARYFTLHLFIILMATASLMSRQLAPLCAHWRPRRIVAMIIGLVTAIILVRLPLTVLQDKDTTHFLVQNPTNLQFDTTGLAHCVSGDPGILVVDSPRTTAKAGALTGMRFFMYPINMSRLSLNEQREFLKRFNINAVLLSEWNNKVRWKLKKISGLLSQNPQCKMPVFLVTHEGPQ